MEETLQEVLEHVLEIRKMVEIDHKWIQGRLARKSDDDRATVKRERDRKERLLRKWSRPRNPLEGVVEGAVQNVMYSPTVTRIVCKRVKELRGLEWVTMQIANERYAVLVEEVVYVWNWETFQVPWVKKGSGGYFHFFKRWKGFSEKLDKLLEKPSKAAEYTIGFPRGDVLVGNRWKDGQWSTDAVNKFREVRMWKILIDVVSQVCDRLIVKRKSENARKFFDMLNLEDREVCGHAWEPSALHNGCKIVGINTYFHKQVHSESAAIKLLRDAVDRGFTFRKG